MMDLIIFDKKTKTKHPNTMSFRIVSEGKEYRENVVSIGGGSIVTVDNFQELNNQDVYPHRHMSEIVEYCQANDISFYGYVIRFEGEEIFEYFKDVLRVMDEAYERGLKAEGVLHGRRALYSLSGTNCFPEWCSRLWRHHGGQRHTRHW